MSWDRRKYLVQLGEFVECDAKEGDSPVTENLSIIVCIPSSMEHVEFRVNQRGPPRKAKYS